MKNLRKLREEAHKTQLRLALDLEISQDAVSLYELGKRIPPPEMIFRIADYFDCSLDYLFGLSEVKKPVYDPSLGNITCKEAAVLRKMRKLTLYGFGKVDGFIDGLLQHPEDMEE